MLYCADAVDEYRGDARADIQRVSRKEHDIRVLYDDGEYLVNMTHPMEKEHFITGMLAVSDNGCQFVKLYPEGEAMARFRPERVKWIYAFCNRHGMFRISVKGIRK